MKFVDNKADHSYDDMVNSEKFVALKCAHLLKGFGFNFDVEKFLQYDKMQILKKIWSSHATNPKALEVISCICIGYDIDQPIIWNNLLTQMVKLRMQSELEAIIDIVLTKQPLVQLEGLVTAYEYLIRASLKDLKKERSEAQDSIACKALFVLQSCPVKEKMNLLDMAATFCRLQQYHAAAVLIALADGDQKREILTVSRPALLTSPFSL